VERTFSALGRDEQLRRIESARTLIAALRLEPASAKRQLALDLLEAGVSRAVDAMPEPRP
jgi:hypothetical protein